MDRIKVLIVEHFLPTNTYTNELVKALSENCELTVLTTRNYIHDKKLNWRCKAKLNKAYCKPLLLSGGYIVLSWLYIVWEILFYKYDVVHVQTFKIPQIEMVLYRVCASNRLVHTVHNIMPHEVSNGDYKRYKKFYEQCNELIVHNNYCKQVLIQNYLIDESKITVVPHGTYEVVDVSEQKKGDENITEFLTLGLIRKYKGIDVLLEAISLIPIEERKSIHFTIAGNHAVKLDDTDYMALINKWELDELVTFIPKRISDNDLDKLYRCADACIFSYKEIYGSGALLMAYSYGKPTIVSDIPVFIEETNGGKTGLLFKSEDPQALSEKIVEFSRMNEAEVEVIETEIKDIVRSKYNWKVSSQITEDVYRKVIKVDVHKNK